MRTLTRIPRAAGAVAMLALAWAAVHALAASTVADSVFDGGLLGTDSYMRLVRVDELAAGGGWFDSTIDRSNAPFGDELHWTRPFDLLLLTIAFPLSTLLDFDDALFVSGAVTSPLLHLAMMLLLVWAAVPIVGSSRAPMAAVVLLAQPAVLGHTLIGSADHHSLQLVLVVAVIGLFARALRDPQQPRWALGGGAAAGLGVWVSPEMTILAGLAAAFLVGAWVASPERRAATLMGYGAAYTAAVGLAVVVERPPSDWLAVEYDKVSVPHLVTGLSVLIVAATLAAGATWATTPARRAYVVGGASLVALLPIAAFLEGLIAGPGAQVEPAIRPIWLDHVGELQPLLPTDLERLGLMLVYLGPALVGLPVAVRATIRGTGTVRLLWAMTTLFMVAYVVLSLLHVRFASFAAVVVAIASAELLGEIREWIRSVPASIWRRVAWTGAAIGLSVGFTIGGNAVAAAGSDVESDPDAILGCSRDAFAAVDAASSPADIVFAHIDVGPELLYRTEAAIVAGPYHRNDRGILDLQRFFAATDDAASLAVANERGASFVLVCYLLAPPGVYSSEDGESLRDRLLASEAPAWLTEVAGSDEDPRYVLYEIEASR